MTEKWMKDSEWEEEDDKSILLRKERTIHGHGDNQKSMNKKAKETSSEKKEK